MFGALTRRTSCLGICRPFSGTFATFATGTRLKRKEIEYQRALETVYPGTHKCIDGVGITDISTAHAHIEIKRWGHWKAGLGQLVAYNAADPRQNMLLCLFGDDITCDQQKNKIICVLTSLGVHAVAFEDGLAEHDDSKHTVLLKDLVTNKVMHTFRIGTF